MNPTTPQPDRPEQHDRDLGSETTQTVGTTGATQALQTSPTQGYAGAEQTRGSEADQEGTGREDTTYPSQPEPIRPTGTSWATVILGLAALVVGGLVLGVQLIDVDIDWSVATPAVFVGAGGLLVVLGLVALVNRRGQQEQPG